MATKKNKAVKKPKLKVNSKWLTVCQSCKIRLVVFSKLPTACDLCKSSDITKELWK